MKTTQCKWLAQKAILLFLLISFTGCVSLHNKNDLAPVNSEVEAIHRLVLEKKKAVLDKDLDSFLKQIDSSDKEFYIEQKRWFQYYQSTDASDYDLKITDISKRDLNTYVATLTQSYTLGPQKMYKNSTFNKKYVHIQGGWKDGDLEFQQVNTEHFTIKAVMGIDEEIMKRIAAMAEAGFEKVTAAYGEGTTDKTVIKIYDSQTVIRDQTRIGGLDKFFGWYEYPESIKLCINGNIQRIGEATLPHELVHKITLSKSSNLCQWFAEGLAKYFGDFCMEGKTSIEKGWVHRKDHIKSLKWIEDQNLEQIKDQRAINQFYSIAGMMIKHIEESYGKGKSKAIVDALSKFPQRGEEGFEFEKHNQLFIEYLNQAMEEVLKVDKNTFDKKWMAWMENY